MENWSKELSDWERVAEPGFHLHFHRSVLSFFCLVNVTEQQASGREDWTSAESGRAMVSVRSSRLTNTGRRHQQQVGQGVIHGTILTQLFRASSRDGLATHEKVTKDSLTWKMYLKIVFQSLQKNLSCVQLPFWSDWELGVSKLSWTEECLM